MAKYIDAEKITPIMAEYVADVFSRKEHLDDISYGYCMEIADVFRRYAERAKQEQSEVDLEKEYQEFCKDYPFPWSSQYVNREYIDELCLSVARHFAQWGAEHLADARKTSPNDLEEAALSRMKDPDMYLSEAVIDEIGDELLKMAQFGAKWQKEQMMKEAIDGEVEVYEQYEGKATGIITANFADIPTKDIRGKVRIIIVKE